jgi:hypothetical protein
VGLGLVVVAGLWADQPTVLAAAVLPGAAGWSDPGPDLAALRLLAPRDTEPTVSAEFGACAWTMLARLATVPGERHT